MHALRRHAVHTCTSLNGCHTFTVPSQVTMATLTDVLITKVGTISIIQTRVWLTGVC